MGFIFSCFKDVNAEYTADTGFSIRFGNSGVSYCKNCKENEMHCIYQTRTKSKEICVKCLPKKVERKAFKAATIGTLRNYPTDKQDL